jgi:methionine-rich copper-binding protein CopC
MKAVTLRIALLAVFVLVLAPVAAHAHAVLVSSIPKNNAVLHKSPAKVVLNFDSRIERSVSQVVVRDKAKRKVPLQKPRGGYVAGKSNQLIVPLPTLKPGTYRLEYRVLATDGHMTPGAIQFTVSGGKSH